MADPDLQIREGGGGHPDPEIRGGGAVSKKFFSLLRVSFWSKNKGGRAPRAPPLDPPLLTINKQALRKVTGVSTERAVTLLLKLSVISSVW